MSEYSDENASLRASVHRGDPHALAAMLSQCRDRLRRMVEFRLDTRLRGRVSASDVLQEAYIDALKRLPHFQAEPETPFFVWARTVVIQRLIQVHREHLGALARDASREVPLGREGSIEASSDKMAGLMADVTSPSQAIERGELVQSVQRALDRLDPPAREVLALRHFEELSNQEAAAVLGIRPAAASKRYMRALERLRQLMEPSHRTNGDTPWPA